MFMLEKYLNFLQKITHSWLSSFHQRSCLSSAPLIRPCQPPGRAFDNQLSRILLEHVTCAIFWLENREHSNIIRHFFLLYSFRKILFFKKPFWKNWIVLIFDIWLFWVIFDILRHFWHFETFLDILTHFWHFNSWLRVYLFCISNLFCIVFEIF